MASVNPLQELMMALMQRGNAGGLPMKPSPELQAFLAQAGPGGTTPNVRWADGSPMQPFEQEYMQGMPQDTNISMGPQDSTVYRPVGADAGPTPIPISQDPWFDEMGLPTGAFDEAPMPGGAPPSSGLDYQTMMNDIMGTSPMAAASSAPPTGGFIIYATRPDGRKVALDGPFPDEITAQRELNMMRQEQRPGSTMNLSVGPAE